MCVFFFCCYTFCSFGIGHRSCIGKKFAKIEAVIVLTMLLQRYSVHLHDEHYEMKVATGSLTTKPRERVMIRFERR